MTSFRATAKKSKTPWSMAKYIVTIAPPSPNGDLHLGHISGPFLAADVFARVRRVRKDEVILVCYSDDYQDYVARMAVQQHRDKFELATHFAHRIESTLKKCDIELDWFLKSYQNRYYKEAIALFYRGAVAAGQIVATEAQVPYSEEDEEYGYEAFARGICNFCGEESDASQCEDCAYAPVMEEMGELRSIFSKKPMEMVPKQREFLRLSAYRSYLREHYERLPAVREHLETYLKEVLALEATYLDWFIDRPDGHGIDLEVDGVEKTIHTWFSGLAGYYAATEEFAHYTKQPELHRAFWQSKETTIVNFLGFDCAFSHAIVYPSLLSNVPGHTNRVIPITNKFLKLEGKDFSTSRRHAIWADEILDEVSADALRFYLAMVSPEEAVDNFEQEKFYHWHENFYKTSIDLLQQFMQDYPPGSFNIDLAPDGLRTELERFKDKWNFFSETDNFSISKIAITLQELLSVITRGIREQDAGMRVAVQMYLVMAQPIHPALSDQLIERYQIDRDRVIDWLSLNYEVA